MKTKRILIATAVVLLLSLGVIACSRAKTDAQIIGEVVTRIHADPQVSNKQIYVVASNGVVTLTGSAATDAERALVANDAAQVEGVKTVVNNLLVAGVPVAIPQPAEVQATQPTPVAKAAPARARKPAAYRERQVAKDAYIPPVLGSSPSYSAPTPTMTTAPTPVASIPTPPPAPTPVTIEPGTVLSVRMIDSINSEKNHQGDMFHGTLDSPVTVNDMVVIPEGADVTGRSPRDMNEAAVAYVPADRHRFGLITPFSLADNLVLTSYYRRPYARGVIRDGDAIQRDALSSIERFDIRTPSATVTAGTLSGGNQQKAVVAREFDRDLKLLVLDQPTRGLDVGSIEFIHRQVIAKRDAGTAVLLVSAELDEVLEMSDRIGVMYAGRIVAIVEGRTADKNEVGLLMATGGADRSGITPVEARP